MLISISKFSRQIACFESSLRSPAECLADLMWATIIFFFTESGSLQALQNNLLPLVENGSSGNCVMRSRTSTLLGSDATRPLHLFFPVGGFDVTLAKSEGLGALKTLKSERYI